MRPKVMKQRARAAALACVMVTPLGLAACAEEGASGTGGGGAGVEFGASKADYRKAFEDISPITLHTQTPSPKGSPSGARNEDYYAAVEDWSGGKITFDVQYSSAVAAPEEQDDALNDGRLDISNVMPVYEPSEYPANGMVNDVSFLGTQKPVIGPMAAQAWMLELGYATPEVRDEYREHGVELILPSFNSGLNLVICPKAATEPADFSGKQVIAGGATQTKEIEALGSSPVSIPFTEVFESLERGVADCTGSTLLGADLGGYLPIAHQVSYSPDQGFAITTGTFGMSEATWSSLPLVARQLLFDRLDVYLESSVSGTFDAMAKAIASIEKEGGGFSTFGTETTDALAKANEGLLEKARGSDKIKDPGGFVDHATEASARWEKEVVDLGYPATDSYDEFATWWKAGDVDLKPFVKALFEKIMLDERPS